MSTSISGSCVPGYLADGGRAGLPHVFQNRAGELDEAEAAPDRSEAFIRAAIPV